MAKRLDCCIECWEDFRYDDCGGYNPPCSCGFHCRRCHEIEAAREAEWEDDDEPDDLTPAKAAVQPPSSPTDNRGTE